jgi:hypothetical protein
MFRGLLIWLILFLTAPASAQVEPVIPEESPRLEIVIDTSPNIRALWYYFPENRFVDSLRDDSLAKRFAVGLELQIPSLKTYRDKDPFDPFVHDTYLRKSRAKTWYFLVALFLLIYIIYYKSAFPRQFELRLKSLFKSYFFEDLMRDQQISSAAGSIHAFSIGLIVFVLGIMLYMINLDFNNLNGFLIFILVFVAWSGLSVGLFALQWIFTFSLHFNAMLLRGLQRQLNINLALALVMLPLFVVAYYNGRYGQEQWVLDNMFLILIAWISLRLFLQFIGMIQDAVLNLTTILYFCSLEIIPYLLLIKFLQNTL